MALNIKLDHGNRHVFAPGDNVTGTVTYVVKTASNEIRDISIAFDGNINTRVKSSAMPDSRFDGEWVGAEENLKIVNLQQRLMKGPYSVRPQTLTHKFAFTIPKTYTPEKADQLATSFVSPYAQDKLPPSLNSGVKDPYSSAKITYTLRATVEEAKSRKVELAELPVSVGHFSAKSLQRPQTYRFKFPLEKWSSLRANVLSLRQKLSHFAHFDAPAIAIDGRLHIAEVLSPTQVIPIKFSANQVREKEADPLAPILKLKTLTLTLYGFTELLCWFPKHHTGPKSIGHTHKEELASKTYTNFPRDSSHVMPLDGSSIEIAPKWSLAQFAGSTPVVPDFTSALTRHWHSVHAHVELMHEASNHVMKLNIEVPVQVIPPFEPERSPKPSPPAVKVSPPPRLSSDSQDAQQYHELPVYTPRATPSHSPAPEHRIKRKSVEGAVLTGRPPSYPGRPTFVPAVSEPELAPVPEPMAMGPSGKVLRVINP